MTPDKFTDQLIEAFLREFDGRLAAVALYGSKVEPEFTDRWSDTDLILVFRPEEQPKLRALNELVSRLGRILGREVHHQTGKLVARYVIQSGPTIEALDLSVFGYDQWLAEKTVSPGPHRLLWGKFPERKGALDADGSPAPYSAAAIDANWFLYYECVKKLKRRDNLIGLHLLLKLMQENLVLEMIARDEETGTNIHRFGGNEPVRWLSGLHKLEADNTALLLENLRQLSAWYDQQLLNRIPDYESRFSAFVEYLEVE
ncbi:nucleotidyltransferase domain-containing protein [Flavilitoribacter nigricans]|nr:nucleotidyltransferase domain-containing protein [Flavilitoribacter nigricans]